MTISKSTKRGYFPRDEHDFKGASLKKLSQAVMDVSWLMDHGYPRKSASVFVGNHYLLTARQRLAMTRIVDSTNAISMRQAKKEKNNTIADKSVNIDGFNLIITLEVALSGSPVLKCMDGLFRDLAGLRGTYRLIDKTGKAVRLILLELHRLGVKQANFWLDAPVSNSGKLKTYIAKLAGETRMNTNIEIVRNVDKVLYTLPRVISSDSIVLNECISWINLLENILPHIPNVWVIDVSA